MTPDVRQMNYWLKNSAATVHAAVIWMFSALRNKGVDNPNVAVLSRSNSLISDMSMFLSEHHSYRGYIMKSRSKEMLDRAKAAMVAAVEIYNKPGFPYRAETFVILAINGWELLCKAKWLSDHDNRRECLYVYESHENADGKKSQRKYIRRTEANNPFTHSLSYLSEKLRAENILDQSAWRNIKAIQEMRDSAIHFYNQGLSFRIRLQEVGAACVRNFTTAVQDWFGENLSEFNLYLMPLAFINLPNQVDGISFAPEEVNFLSFLNKLEDYQDASRSNYSVTINMDVKFTRSKAKSALRAQISTDPNAPAVRITEEHIREKYPWDFKQLTEKCKERYLNFKQDQKYHDLRKSLQKDQKYGTIRLLDPNNPNGQKKPYFNPNILTEFDKHYTRVQGKS